MPTTDQLLQGVELLLLLLNLSLLLFDQLLLLLDLCVLLLKLRLLLFESVNEDGGELIVFDAFDLAFRVAKGEQWLDLLNFFGGEADVFHTVLLPLERDRAQAIDDLESAYEWRDVALVAQAG